MDLLLRTALDVIKAWDGMQIESSSEAGLLAMANLRTAIALIKVGENELGSLHVSATGDESRKGPGVCIR
jgi:hypothetical protein